MEQQLPNRFVEIGRVGKARGLDGTIRFVPGQQFTDEGALSESGILYIRNERSDLVPMRIEKVNREFRRNQPSFFVKFDLIASREEADSARGRALFLDRSTAVPGSDGDDETDIDYFGYEIIWKNRLFGEVLDVMENPAHPILEVKMESDGGVLLIPFVDEFIESADHQRQQLICKELDQLTDL